MITAALGTTKITQKDTPSAVDRLTLNLRPIMAMLCTVADPALSRGMPPSLAAWQFFASTLILLHKPGG